MRMRLQISSLSLTLLLAVSSVLHAQVPTREAAQQELAAAEARYRSALALAPEMAAYHFSLALVLERQGRTPEALASYQRAAQLDSLSARHRAGYGMALLREGKALEAEEQLRAAVVLDRNSVEYHEALATVYDSLGQWVDAAASLRTASQLAPGDAKLIARLKDAEIKAGTPTEVHYGDQSDFEDDIGGSRIPVFEILFGTIFSVAALALFAPVFGTFFLLAQHAAGTLLKGRTA